MWHSPGVWRRLGCGRWCPAGLRRWGGGGWALLAAQAEAQPQPQAAGWPRLLAHALQVAHVDLASALPLRAEPGLFLRKGRGLSGAGPCSAPVPHTMGQEQGSWEALKSRLHARQPTGWGADAWVPLQGLGLISGNPGVQQCSGAGVQELGVGAGEWQDDNQRVRRAILWCLTRGGLPPGLCWPCPEGSCRR